MASLTSHPLFFTSLLLSGALAAGQAWLIYSQNAQIDKERVVIDQKRSTLQGFASQNPFPSKENQAAVEAGRASLEKIRENIRGELRATSDVAKTIAAATVPASSFDAYFDLASFVERVREAAEKHEVKVGPESRFGFSDYVKTGPDRELIPKVFIQRQYAEYLINSVINSAPSELIGLQRERPLTAEEKRIADEALAAGQAPSSSSDTGVTGDFFVIDPRISARVPGFVETEPFRIAFTGLTAALRSFLNELATFKLPVVVRSVEVESLSRGESVTSKPSYSSSSESSETEAESEKPVVEPSISRFVVTVEIVKLVDKTVPVETAPTP